VLGRTIVLRVSSGCLNTGSCSFHLVAARKTRVAGWCKGELLFFVIVRDNVYLSLLFRMIRGSNFAQKFKVLGIASNRTRA
jgi:hypothetical protein